MTKLRYRLMVCVTQKDHRTVRRLATRAGLSMSDYVRRAINAILLEEGTDDAFLREMNAPRGRSKTAAETGSLSW